MVYVAAGIPNQYIRDRAVNPFAVAPLSVSVLGAHDYLDIKKALTSLGIPATNNLCWRYS
eukprot:1154959-Pelagomonas_calceolata.AAC.3